MSTAKILNKQRKRMFEEHPFCHWCGRPLQLIERNGGVARGDAATIDHVYSRLHPDRVTPCHNEKRRVLACYKCNNERSREETKITYLKRQQEKSGSRPLESFSYLERKWRLKQLQEKVESGIQGLIRVMGLPIREKVKCED